MRHINEIRYHSYMERKSNVFMKHKPLDCKICPGRWKSRIYHERVMKHVIELQHFYKKSTKDHMKSFLYAE